jgi:cell fate regulator YaaT (PSP1 superfamily)
MYNIDLSFVKNSELEAEKPDFSNSYNERYKEKIIKELNKLLLSKTECDDCDIDLSAETPPDSRNIIEANSKGLIGKHFCEIKTDKISVKKDDLILVQIPEGVEIAIVTETATAAKYKHRKRGLSGEELPTVLRKLTEEDIKKYETNLKDEKSAKEFFLKAIATHKLEMKLVDVHYQFDRKKLYFYYTADGRIDFRQLVKELATEFKTRIELRQIGVRDEAKIIGGIGSCGREYCCTGFITNFKKVTTQIASEQNLSSFLSKHSGPCGKLKCCLSFEVDYN